MPRVKQLVSSAQGAKVSEYLNIAYKDYLGARVLLNADLLPQACVLASTAIEKYFKAVLAFRGNEARGHLSQKHINAAMNYDKRLSTALSESFLLLLQKAYNIRYTDSLVVGFNMVVAGREFLAELDHTALTIQQSFQMQVNGKEAILRYHTDKQKVEPILFLNNHVLLDMEKQGFISSEAQSVYEVRNCPVRGLLEATYVATARPSDGQFLREGFQPTDDNGMQYKLALAPIHRGVA